MNDIKFYSVGYKTEDNSFNLISKTSTVLENGESFFPDYHESSDDDEFEVGYRVSDCLPDGILGQPYFYDNIREVKEILNEPCLDIGESSYNNPCFDEVDDYIDSLVPVKIHLSKMKLDNSKKVFLRVLNEKHPKFSPDNNNIIQHNDVLPPADATYADDTYRVHIVSKNINDFPIVIE